MSNPNVWERAIARVRSGRHTAVLGTVGFEPRAEPLCVLRIDCARSDRPLGAILEADERLAQLLAQTGSADVSGRVPRDRDETRTPGRIVELANRLLRELDRPAVLLFESIDAADDPSLALLRIIVEAQDALEMPLLLTSRTHELRGEAARLIAALREIEGADAVMVVDIAPERAVSAPRRAEAWPSEVTRVLRAGATVGNTFEAAVVAEMLDVDQLTTLELLQLAHDHGARVQDLGEGVFRLDEGFARELRAEVTPSLATAWHELLANLLLDQGATEAPSRDIEAARRVPRAEANEAGGAYSEIMRKWGGARDFSARAAEHAEAAGQAELAIDHYLEGAVRASKVGGYDRAVELLERALRLMTVSPPAASHRSQRVRALIELGRIKWMATGAGLESFTLPAALAELEAAAALLTPDDPVELRAEVAQLTARVYYDIGGPEQLESACGLLVGARRDLLDAGRPLEAARMLNDEATVRVRRGELDRAAELLNRAREMFVRFADASPVAQREVAQTEHLVARLVLHAPEQQRRDREALRFALERAHAAEAGYAQIGDQREHARVWETLARIERLLDERESAMQHLQSAVQVQSRLGDAVGMARTTAALAELMADTGRFEDAVGLLDESVALNVSKGSLSGLAYNRRGLDELCSRMSPRDRDALGSTLELLRSRIEGARA